ncbi:hypothetical protein R4Z10_19500 [Niallia sp. XMNu-256]|uniref:hypothetical protein n=1 Tax=Niallia sp. XMNu-256 TaxID=3082444 RepID=UPI0030CD85C2
MDKILNQLFNDTINEIDNQNLNIFEENISLMYEILEKILEESVQPNKSNLYKSLLLYLDLICKQLLDRGLEQTAIDLIIKVYKIINKSKQDNLFVYFGDSINMLLKQMREYRFNQLLQLHWDQLIYHMVSNAGLNDNEVLVDNNIPTFIQSMYTSINENKILESNDKEYLLDRILEDVFRFEYYNNADYTKIIIFRTLNNLLLIMIRIKDRSSLKRALEMVRAKKIHLDSTVVTKVYLTISAYLYYLVYKEGMEEIDKREYILIFENLKEQLLDSLEFYDTHQFWMHYKAIKLELKRWELIDGDSKWLMMDNVVREYFLFLTIINDLDLTSVSQDILTEAELFSIINPYLNKNQLSENLVYMYKQFVEAFSNEDRNIYADMKRFKEEALLMYKYFRLKEVREDSKNEEQIEENLKNLKFEIEKGLRVSPILDGMIVLKEAEEVKHHTLEQNINTPVTFIANQRNYSIDSFKQTILHTFERNLIHTLIQYGFINESIPHTHPQKINNLLKLVERINKINVSNINVFISGIAPDSPQLYQEDDISKLAYTNFTNAVEKYIIANQRYWLGYDNRTISVRVKNCEVKMVKMNESEIREKLTEIQKEKDKYLINVTNEIYLPFTKEEAMEYLFLNNVKIQVNIELVVEKNDNVSGFYMKIKYS